MSLPYAFSHLRPRRVFLGTTATDAWDAMYAKAKAKNFGTSKQDIDDYAAAGGSVAAAAACAAAGAPEASPLCAYVGGTLASVVADTIQSIGAALFGGDDFHPQPNDTWNPRADAAIGSIVRALRLKKGLDADHPPGGSFRGFPEWWGVAEVWAKKVNLYVKLKGGPIVWFYETGNGTKGQGQAGRIRQDAIDQWIACAGTWNQQTGNFDYPPKEKCALPDGKSASAPLPAAIVVGTQQATMQVLGVDAQGRPMAKSSSAAPIVVGGGIAAFLAWKLLPRLL